MLVHLQLQVLLHLHLQLHEVRSLPDDGRRLTPGLSRHDSSVEGIGSDAKAPVRRQQAPITVVTSTRLAHGPVVDFGHGPAAAGMIARSQSSAQPLFDQLHQLDLVPMTVVGSRLASPCMIAQSKALARTLKLQ